MDLYLDGRYFENARMHINIPNINIHLFKSVNSILEDLKNKNVKNILVEEEFFLLSEYNNMKLYFDKIIPYPTKILRIQKDIDEIANLKMASKIVCETME